MFFAAMLSELKAEAVAVANNISITEENNYGGRD